MNSAAEKSRSRCNSAGTKNQSRPSRRLRSLEERTAFLGCWLAKGGEGGEKVEYSHDTVRPSPTRGIPDKAVEHLLEACSVL